MIPEQHDLRKLARTGMQKMVPCGDCSKQTKSHLIANHGSGWSEMGTDYPFGSIEPGTEIELTVVCHSCFTDMGDGWEPNRDDALKGVVG